MTIGDGKQMMEQPSRYDYSFDPDWDRSFEDIEDELDDGIRNTVKFLMENGFYTIESFDGDLGGYGSDPAESFVRMLCEPEYIVTESTRLLRIMAELGFDSSHADNVRHDGAARPYVEAVFSPIDPYAIISLYCFNDRLLAASLDNDVN